MPDKKEELKKRLEASGFHRLHKILESRPEDRALRVDRDILESMMIEILAAAKKVETVRKQLKARMVDFTKGEQEESESQVEVWRNAAESLNNYIHSDDPSDDDKEKADGLLEVARAFDANDEREEDRHG